MKIYVQWTRLNPRGWAIYDSSVWGALPFKTAPGSLEVLDDLPGWVHAVNVQGLIFSGDHYAIEDLPDGGIRFILWNDDQLDFGDTHKNAHVWTIGKLSPDARLGGAYNTKQTRILYAQRGFLDQFYKNMKLDNTEIRDWSEFISPTRGARHGIEVSDPLNATHFRLPSEHGFETEIFRSIRSGNVGRKLSRGGTVTTSGTKIGSVSG